MNWRLILDGAASGAWNMATDEALLLSQEPGDTPVLRFYGWDPACISLGRFQKASSFRLHPSSFNIVRRPTGGRAIWHQHEITYSVVLREEILPREAHSVIGSYQWLSRAFITGLQTIGVSAQLSEGHKSGAHDENCFASAARSDFVVDGRKLIGAAQCRKNGAVLQHGSLLLKVEAEAWHRAVGGSMQETISLNELGVTASRVEIIAALCAGMQHSLGAQLEQDELCQSEKTLLNRLYSQKYTVDYWNFSGQEP